MNDINKYRKLYFWGVGDDIVRIIKRWPIMGRCAEGYIDMNRYGEVFSKKQVYHPQDIDWNDNLFIVISTRKYYGEIKTILQNKGLIEYVDFAGYDNAWKWWRASLEDSNLEMRIHEVEMTVKSLKKWIPGIGDVLYQESDFIRDYIFDRNGNLYEILLKLCSNGKERSITLRGNIIFEYNNISDFAVIFRELLENEDYYFEVKRMLL